MATRSIAEHYDQHLAEHYSWLFGGLPERVEENLRTFEALGWKPTASARALDIGAGSGFQSIPLARLGYSVTAVDLSRKLLDELSAHAEASASGAREALPIVTVCDDILRWVASREAPRDLELCVCMGDTLTHLPSFGDVQRLLRELHRMLLPGGRCVFAFRDFTQELVGEARFIPVRSDEHAIFTCFLEYEGDHVRVYDVIHVRRASDQHWDMRVSSYKKLRIAPDWFAKRATEAGFVIDRKSDERGLVTLVMHKA